MKVLSIIFIPALMLVFAGCSVISKEVRTQVDRSVTVEMVRAAPEDFRGTGVLWGGRILESTNLEDSTEIEVLELALAVDDTPKEDSPSGGRFIVRAPGFLDTSIFEPDRFVTVAGVVEGSETRKIGRMDYVYPIVKPLELKLSKPERERRYYDYPPPWWWYPPYDPLYPYHPWRYPYHPYYP